MEILIATDSFKESLSAQAVGECIERGFSEVFPKARYHQMPLADGGEGTVEVLLQSLGGEKRTSRVEDALGRPISAEWALLDSGRTALIEIAAASGLADIEPAQRNPLIASSYGTGQLVREALDNGVENIIMGLGGSATNDGGAGILQALGGKLLDKNGQELAKGGAALADLARIDLTDLHPRALLVSLTIASDVSNPLCGDNGASAIFGPQKGATPQMVAELDKALANFADVSQKTTGISRHDSTSFGAAGGAAMGLSLATELQIKSGIDVVLDTLHADKILSAIDLVITGEGQMDNQTLQGKVPFGIAKRAKARGIPVIAIAGSLGNEVEALYTIMDATFDTVRAPQTLPQVLAEAEQNVIRTARNVAMLLKLGKTL